VALDLKSTEGVNVLIRMLKNADVLLDPMRPGVLEKMGLGPDFLLREVNPKLIVARVTGWGQTGPMAQAAGHDTNYVALTGIMSLFARNDKEAPLPPVNLLGDFAGGGMLAALGIMIALYERNKSGKGQVVDAAMVDGVSHLATFIHRMRTNKVWKDQPGTNLLDTGAPFYDTYVCSDGKFLSLGSIEPQFYSLMLEGLGLKDDDMPGSQMDREKFADNKRVIAGRIMQKPRDYWAKVFAPEGKYRDACVAPVLTIPEAMEHPHNVAREVFFKFGKKGEYLPQPAPRLSRTPGHNYPSWSVAKPGANTRTVLMLYGFTDKEVQDLEKKGVIGIAPEAKM
jgi:alpha-methylacyl-CoA racemase